MEKIKIHVLNFFFCVICNISCELNRLTQIKYVLDKVVIAYIPPSLKLYIYQSSVLNFNSA